MTARSTSFIIVAMLRSLRWIGLLGVFILSACNSVGDIPEIRPSLDPTYTPTSTNTPEPSPTPTPTEIPVVPLEQAGRAYFNGDWEAAINFYTSIQESSDQISEKIEASLGLVKTLVEDERYAEAEAQLTLLLDQYPTEPQSGRAYYLLGTVLEAQERYLEAAWAYEQYAERNPGILGGYEYELVGDAYRNADDPLSAIEAYSSAQLYASHQRNLNLRIKIARARAASGDYNAALADYIAIYDSTDNGYIRAQMDLLMGRAYEWLGQNENAYARYLDAVENYPLSFDSYTSLVSLVEAGVPVNELDRGIVDYYAGQYGVAIEAFDRYLKAVPDEHDGTVHQFKALALRILGDLNGAIAEWDMLIDTHPGDRFWEESWMNKAITQWAYLEDYEGAIDTYLTFVSRQPDSAMAPEMLADAGRVAERAGDLNRAIQILTRVGEEYPDSEFASGAMFKSGISHYRLGNYQDALVAFESSVMNATEPDDRAAAYLWIGKAKEQLGDSAGRDSAWQAAMLADPNGYYGLRASGLYEGEEPFESKGVFDFNANTDAERAEAEIWLRETFAIDATGDLWKLSQELASDPRMEQAEEFWALGELEVARGLFEEVRLDHLNDPLATYQLMHRYLELGLYQPAIYSAAGILNQAGLGDAIIQDSPIYLSKIRFGPYFGDLLLPAALERGLDPLFLLSVARQESLFESFATSYADARGILQIIPSTGQEIVGREGWPADYTSDDLYRPIVSARLGSRYLADQRDLFDGDLFAALSAYNAGPGNTLAWIELAPDDPDLFLEILRLEQPQNYIRSIYWAFTQYSDLYVQEDS